MEQRAIRLIYTTDVFTSKQGWDLYRRKRTLQLRNCNIASSIVSWKHLMSNCTMETITDAGTTLWKNYEQLVDRAWFRGLDELHQFLNPYECTDTYKQPYPVPAITSSRGDGRGHERQRVTQRKMTNRGKTKETDRGNVRSQEKCRFKSSMGGIHGAERLDTRGLFVSSRLTAGSRHIYQQIARSQRVPRARTLSRKNLAGIGHDRGKSRQNGKKEKCRQNGETLVCHRWGK